MFLRRAHLCDTRITAPPVVRTNVAANSKSGFPCYGKCTTDGFPIVVLPHDADSDPGSAQ